MSAELRRFPRVLLNEPGELEVQVRHSDPDAGVTRVPVTVRSISCEGAGLSIQGDDIHLVPGAIVRLFFTIPEHALELPARVVWSAGTKAGIRLRLGTIDADSKRAYASWIVPLTNKEIARLRDQV